MAARGRERAVGSPAKIRNSGRSLESYGLTVLNDIRSCVLRLSPEAVCDNCITDSGQTTIELKSGSALHRDSQLAATAPFSMAGVPVAAIPVGQIGQLPVGFELVTPLGEDGLALNLAKWAERALGNTSRPD
jgi:hypothetical protein